MAHAKIKKFSEKFAFSNFLNIFQFFINFNAIFEKLPQILGLYPIVKFRSDPRKSDPQTFGGPPQPKNPACIIVYFFEINQY